MLSYEPEIAALRDAGALAPAVAERLVKVERRELFSIHYELRVVTYAAIVAIVTGVGILLKENLERIGPLTIVLAIAAAAAALYAFVWSRRRRSEYSVFHEYLVLLATLLIGADLAYAERTFDILGRNGYDHFLAVALFNAVVAYLFRSRLVLATSLTSLAAWFGINRTLAEVFSTSVEVGRQAMLCAAVILVWRELHRRSGKSDELLPPFDHYAANLVGIAVAAWTLDEPMQWLGFVLAIALGITLFTLARRRRSELFLLYALGYSLFALSVVVTRLLRGYETLVFFYFIGILGTAIVALFIAHMKWRFDE